LPGPRTLAAFFPDEADLASLGPIAGRLHLLHRSGDSAAAAFDLTLDLKNTPWIDTSAVHVRMEGPALKVDPVLVQAGDMRFDLRGILDLESYAGSGELLLSDSGFLRRFSTSIPEMDLAVRGTSGSDPGGPGNRIEVSMEGSVRGDAYAIPLMTGNLVRSGEGMRVEVSLPEGVTSDLARLDSVHLDYAVPGGQTDFLPAIFGLNIHAEGVAFEQVSRVAAGDTVRIDVESMLIGLQDRELRSLGPFSIMLNPSTRAIAVAGMNLEGDLGRLGISGVAGPDSVEIRGNVKITLPEEVPGAISYPPVLWPDSLALDFVALGEDSLHLTGVIDGLILDDGSRGTVNVDVAAGEGVTLSKVTVMDERSTVLEAAASLPARVAVYPLALEFHAGDAAIAVRLSEYPVAIKETFAGGLDPAKLVARVDADLQVAGPLRAPGGLFEAGVSFPSWPEMSDLGIEIEGVFMADSISDPQLAPLAGETALRIAKTLGIERVEELAVSIVLSRGERPLLESSLSYPVRASIDPPHAEVRTGGEANLFVRAPELPLEEIDLFLPAGVGLDGELAIDLTSRGPVGEANLLGSLDATNLKIEFDKLASVLMKGAVRFDGTTRNPRFVGGFTIQNGLITIPEVPPDLLPVEGQAILRDTHWRDDPGAKAGGPVETDSLAASRPEAFDIKADYDIDLDFPGGFWLRGEGLEIEFTGNLRIVQKDGMPVIDGNLEARRGSFIFLGRSFELERGLINFYGEAALDPSLDISLTSSIDGNRVWINLTETLEEPRLKLTSDPEMTEGDIMAMILFGKPFNELNDGQGNMLRDRTAAILMGMGVAKLQHQLAGQYGVDLVSVRASREKDTESALVVGKYLTPKLLVMYEQGLRQDSSSYIVMEYLLTRNLRLETLSSNQNKVGAGISIQRDY
jgi:hypothetical protein